MTVKEAQHLALDYVVRMVDSPNGNSFLSLYEVKDISDHLDYQNPQPLIALSVLLKNRYVTESSNYIGSVSIEYRQYFAKLLGSLINSIVAATSSTSNRYLIRGDVLGNILSIMQYCFPQDYVKWDSSERDTLSRVVSLSTGCSYELNMRLINYVNKLSESVSHLSDHHDSAVKLQNLCISFAGDLQFSEDFLAGYYPALAKELGVDPTLPVDWLAEIVDITSIPNMFLLIQKPLASYANWIAKRDEK